MIEVCPKCAGIWFDDGELSELIERSPHLLTELDNAAIPTLEAVGDGPKVRSCPHGHTLLETYRYLYDSPIEIESCPMCNGVFIDNDELAEIAEFLEDEYRGRVTSAMQARNMLTGHTVTSVSNRNEDEAVSGLVHALTHWHNRKRTD
jgi:Zn-finger nucleic acid-binding protein